MSKTARTILSSSVVFSVWLCVGKPLPAQQAVPSLDEVLKQGLNAYKSLAQREAAAEDPSSECYVARALLTYALLRVGRREAVDDLFSDDAYYYAVGAQQLYKGQGFTEPFVWNYLDPPETVPHPGFSYWMPLASILGWLGLGLLGDSFGAMQAPLSCCRRCCRWWPMPLPAT